MGVVTEFMVRWLFDRTIAAVETNKLVIQNVHSIPLTTHSLTNGCHRELCHITEGQPEKHDEDEDMLSETKKEN
jgi:hypothetical protein